MSSDLPYVVERLTSEADLDEVAALEAASFTNPWTRELLARELGHSDTMRVYVLRTPERRVAAFCSCWWIADELHINTVAVEERLRRRGLALALLGGLLEEAAADGIERATLEVRRSNVAALRLYERLGFAVEAVRPQYYTHPEEDALILWKRDLAARRMP
ncbi:MAG: ribosomal-protein-alanine N-acetyltransferase [Acidobacteria bacterium RIFCSPLOWO2_02_FULL_67_36]|nr:MAG: ribosomal-protein-alanine N-acetyltransferase [Acidobacteria bacterium RIFCSPLOWO2_02_FULL_67_36]OFW23298.1 MAG: ribosomal-protein-alanine N-acetyltransferase [Acidobacteria bacterium RIFCSPLOWO2_12_FULL_66_21]